MPPTPVRGVVFDFDGVISRSMELHAEAYRRVLAPFGLLPTDREVFLQEGARSETILRDALHQARGMPPDPQEVRDLSVQKQAVYRALGPPRLYPGAEALVREVHARDPHVALVTGTRRENLERLIPHLLPLFEVVLAQDGYTHDKPHPEPYLRAAEALLLPPSACVVLENAVRGVASARAAGYGHIVAITTTVSSEDLAEADVVVPDHKAARDAIFRWLER